MLHEPGARKWMHFEHCSFEVPWSEVYLTVDLAYFMSAPHFEPTAVALLHVMLAAANTDTDTISGKASWSHDGPRPLSGCTINEFAGDFIFEVIEPFDLAVPIVFLHIILQEL